MEMSEKEMMILRFLFLLAGEYIPKLRYACPGIDNDPFSI